MIKHIPANIIMGFLGVGKTTAILAFLASKPKHEHWAVLVNEFGEIGIDGAILAGSSDGDISIREVPGGCMCCAAGVPMHVALSQLIARTKPDRVLIEPSGLGHPKEVIQALRTYEQQGVLDLHATLTLVDARKVSDKRYAENTLFRQQIEVADVIVANKKDLYQFDELAQLERYLMTIGVSGVPIELAEAAECDIALLDHPKRTKPQTDTLQQYSPSGHFAGDTSVLDDGALTAQNLPECGYIRRQHRHAEMQTIGWLFDPRFMFSFELIENWLMGLRCQRLKAVIITSEGSFTFNKVDEVLTCVAIDEAFDSRMDLIFDDSHDANRLEVELLSCLAPPRN